MEKSVFQFGPTLRLKIKNTILWIIFTGISLYAMKTFEIANLLVRTIKFFFNFTRTGYLE